MPNPANTIPENVESTDENPIVGAGETGETATPEPEPSGEPKQEERKFTQAELDAAVQKRLRREMRAIQRSDWKRGNTPSSPVQTAAEPRRESFKDDAAYAEARVEFLANRRAEAILAEREQEREGRRVADAFHEKAEAIADQYPDFESVVHNPNLPITPSMAEYLTDSEKGPELAYYLGKNPLKAAEIARLSPIRAARELMKLETDLAKPKPKLSAAPDPITPVGTRGRSTSSLPSDDDDIDTWMRKERARVAKSR